MVAPSGKYDAANVGLNIWTFETGLMVTYFDEEKGRGWSVVLGYGDNKENDDTDYQTGDEVHLDLVLNQFFSESSAIGVNGFYYKQIGGDSGDGVILGDFKGEASAIGPALRSTGDASCSVGTPSCRSSRCTSSIRRTASTAITSTHRIPSDSDLQLKPLGRPEAGLYSRADLVDNSDARLRADMR